MRHDLRDIEGIIDFFTSRSTRREAIAAVVIGIVVAIVAWRLGLRP